MFQFRKILALSAMMLLVSVCSHAQSDRDYLDMVNTTAKQSNKILKGKMENGWKYDWLGKLNGSQASFRNWSRGGVNTVSLTAATNFDLMHRKDQFGYNLVINLQYGQARIDGEENRKTDDRIVMVNQFKYLIEDHNFSFFGKLNFLTQFDKGYNYRKDPKKLLSRFMSPAYLSQVIGVGYSPKPSLTTQAGLALKETIVKDTTLSTRYGLEKGSNLRFEPGYSFLLNFNKKLVKNVRFISTLETFSNLRDGLGKTDISFSNELIGKINGNLNTSFEFMLVYDEDFSRDLQLKQVLTVGLSVNIL